MEVWLTNGILGLLEIASARDVERLQNSKIDERRALKGSTGIFAALFYFFVDLHVSRSPRVSNHSEEPPCSFLDGNDLEPPEDALCSVEDYAAAKSWYVHWMEFIRAVVCVDRPPIDQGPAERCSTLKNYADRWDRFLLAQLLLDVSELSWISETPRSTTWIEENDAVEALSFLAQRAHLEGCDSSMCAGLHTTKKSHGSSPMRRSEVSRSRMFYNRFSYLSGLPFLRLQKPVNSSLEEVSNGRPHIPFESEDSVGRVPGAKDLREELIPFLHTLILHAPPSPLSLDALWKGAIDTIAHHVGALLRSPPSEKNSAPSSCVCPLCYAAGRGDMLVLELLLSFIELDQVAEENSFNGSSRKAAASSTLLDHLTMVVSMAVRAGQTAAALRVARVWLFSLSHPLLHGLTSQCARPSLEVNSSVSDLEEAVQTVSHVKPAEHQDEAPYVDLSFKEILSNGLSWNQFLWMQLENFYFFLCDCSVNGAESSYPTLNAVSALGTLQELFACRGVTPFPSDSASAEMALDMRWYWLFGIVAASFPLSGFPVSSEQLENEWQQNKPSSWTSLLGLICFEAVKDNHVQSLDALLLLLRFVVRAMEDLLSSPDRRIWYRFPRCTHLLHVFSRPPSYPLDFSGKTEVAASLHHILREVAGKCIERRHPSLLRLLLSCGAITVEEISPSTLKAFYRDAPFFSAPIAHEQGRAQEIGPCCTDMWMDIHHQLSQRSGVGPSLSTQPPVCESKELPFLFQRLLTTALVKGKVGEKGAALLPPLPAPVMVEELVQQVAGIFKHSYYERVKSEKEASLESEGSAEEKRDEHKVSDMSSLVRTRDLLMRSCFAILEFSPKHPVAWLILLSLLYDAREYLLDSRERETTARYNRQALVLEDLCESVGQPARLSWLQQAVETRSLLWMYTMNERIYRKEKLSSEGKSFDEVALLSISWTALDSRVLLNSLIQRRGRWVTARSLRESLSQCTSGGTEMMRSETTIMKPLDQLENQQELFKLANMACMSELEYWSQWGKHVLLCDESQVPSSEGQPRGAPVLPQPLYVKVLVAASHLPIATLENLNQSGKGLAFLAPILSRSFPVASVWLRLSRKTNLFNDQGRIDGSTPHWGTVDTVVPLGLPYQKGDSLQFVVLWARAAAASPAGAFSTTPRSTVVGGVHFSLDEGEPKESLSLPIFVATHRIPSRPSLYAETHRNLTFSALLAVQQPADTREAITQRSPHVSSPRPAVKPLACQSGENAPCPSSFPGKESCDGFRQSMIVNLEWMWSDLLNSTDTADDSEGEMYFTNMITQLGQDAPSTRRWLEMENEFHVFLDSALL